MASNGGLPSPSNVIRSFVLPRKIQAPLRRRINTPCKCAIYASKTHVMYKMVKVEVLNVKNVAPEMQHSSGIAIGLMPLCWCKQLVPQVDCAREDRLLICIYLALVHCILWPQPCVFIDTKCGGTVLDVV